MGGCRCSYRDCKARSDGQTHMFHFPVFDKVRCHLWIKNAHKPNFLNLKVSQLKNRVICQHHFRNESFMNFKKDKLKHDAVPTEDGPLCIPDSSQPVILTENDIPGIPINVDDIENEKLDSVEKKAHGSVKYGDFLISDATELFNASIDNQTSLKKISYSNRNMELYKGQHDFDHKSKNEDNHKYTINYVNEENTEPKPKPLNQNTPIPSLISIEFDEPLKINNDNSLHNTPTKKLLNSNLGAAMPATSATKKPKVQIISQKTISEPVLVKGRLKQVSPSMIIQKPRRQKRNVTFELGDDNKPIVIKQDNENVQAIVDEKQPEVVFDHNILPIEYIPTPSESDVVNQSSQASSIQHANMIEYEPLQTINLNSIEKNNNSNNGTLDVSQLPIEIFLEDVPGPVQRTTEESYNLTQKPILTPTSTPVYKSLLKSKITPEKLAAIEQKRKFNLKMRDVITSCLDNLDESNDDIFKKLAEQKKQNIQNLLTKQNEKRKLIKKCNPPVTNQDDIIAFLDQRLQKLESTLLNKIVHNTQRINDLRRVIKPSSQSRHANTQTYIKDMCGESQKHFLYKEISKFLSPDANIKIFQELFLDKSEDDKTHIPTPRKLRRRR